MKKFASRSTAFVLTACFFLSAFAALHADTGASKEPKESWVGMYMNGKKMGWTSIRTEPAEYKSKTVTRITSTSISRLELFGQNVSQDTKTLTYTGSSSQPIYQEYRINSNGSTMELKADYQPGKIVCMVTSGSSVSQKVVPVPSGIKLVADSSDPTQGQHVKPGQQETFYYLNPLTVALEKTQVKVEAEEKARLAGTSLTAFRVSADSPFGKMTTWETADGDLIKGEMTFGPVAMVMYREPKAVALDMTSKAPTFEIAGATATSVGEPAYTPPSDFAVATAVKTDKPIKNPREATHLQLELSGVTDKALAISDTRQALKTEQKPDVWLLDVAAKHFDATKAAQLPIKEPSVQKELMRAPFLEADDPEILKTARVLRGTETNSYRVASKIRQWVHAQMKPDYTIGVPRSTAEVFKRRRGVCRDYATLFAGLARAAGIPTRVCGGIVYAEGRFFYHAWAECWVGEWLPFDPTTPVDFVDATHIKFAQGDVTDMYRVAGIIGKLKISVISAD